ncbi:carbohydrate ABC transporter permease [Kineosporia sp. A_224]|uniref:carbohydrate ABC transporter permease n=1 Tax=Kineosporia sp. A_224 TaxID=1962180 RepID=UPI0018E9BAD1|nr:sugar ABC transporter permease [Kineosporia sp. A_224]
MTVFASPAPPRRTRAARTARARRRFVGDLTGWGFAGPATFVVLGLSVFPALWALRISRQKWNGIAPPKPLGWTNYQLMASDPDLFSAVRHTVVLTGLFVPLSLLIGLLIAIALNQKIRFVGFYRTCIFVPFVVSAAVTGILATFVFNPQFGIANAGLRSVGVAPQQFLESPSQVLLVLVLVSLWGSVGFTVVVYLAALQDIPRELTEAALVDGANRRQVFRYVTVPQLRPVTVFTAVWQTITALQLFDIIYTTTRGGPLGASQTVVYYVYYQFRELQRYGYASAVSYGLFAVTMLITLGMVVYARRRGTEAF